MLRSRKACVIMSCSVVSKCRRANIIGYKCSRLSWNRLNTIQITDTNTCTTLGTWSKSGHRCPSKTGLGNSSVSSHQMACRLGFPHVFMSTNVTPQDRTDNVRGTLNT